MLYPQSNLYRWHYDLGGYWRFLPDLNGVADNWHNGLPLDARTIAVPASWNDQFADLRHFLGDGWYETTFTLPPFDRNGKRLFVRFGSVNYKADVWLNGEYLGGHEGGHLPFSFEVTEHLQTHNVLVVRVNRETDPNRVPGGRIQRDPQDNIMRPPQFPDTNHDFFPYAGIHRPVFIYAVPAEHIRDVIVTTEVEGSTGVVSVRVAHEGKAEVRATLYHDAVIFGAQGADLTLHVPHARLWSPDEPNLHTLTIELWDDGIVVDAYSLEIGIRTISVEGDTLLLNGKPIFLRGFGRHEDFPLNGRGYNPVVVIKDYELLRWVGANSFRTTHYPYSEESLALADQQGFLVIAETPSVEMYFHPDGLEARKSRLQSMVSELVARDKNHPSVIMWSLANEPMNQRAESGEFFEALCEQARQLDPTRPLTFASFVGDGDPAFEHCDVVSINRYNGWYTEVGQVERGVAVLEKELDAIHKRHGKPLIMTEFGADAVAGMHYDPPVMFSEEYQALMIEAYLDLMATKPYIVGAHVWNLCDFATSQAITRVGAMNLKGVFTRDRQPKLAAHRLRARWTKPAAPPTTETNSEN